MKKCPSCSEPVQGRTDKKFCSPCCKSAYHYQQNRDRPNNLFKQIDDQMKHNRRILKEYNKAGKATVRKEVLEKAGFSPQYFTHYRSGGLLESQKRKRVLVLLRIWLYEAARKRQKQIRAGAVAALYEVTQQP